MSGVRSPVSGMGCPAALQLLPTPSKVLRGMLPMSGERTRFAGETAGDLMIQVDAQLMHFV